MLFAAQLIAGQVAPAAAANGDCGQPLSSGDTSTAGDALWVLGTAVGLTACDLCVCDVDGSGAITASDALSTLNLAVGLPIEFNCVGCGVSDCDMLTWSAAAGQPFDRLNVQGVPEEFGDIWADVTDGGSPDSPTAAIRRDDGSVDVIIPLHPDAAGNGGQIDVTITNGELSCPTETIDIVALPDAPGTTQTVSGLMAAIAMTYAELHGTTPEALAGTPLDQLPSEQLPLSLAQQTLNDTDNPNSLVKMLAGTATDVDPADTETLDRVLAKIGVADVLQDTLDGIGNLPIPTIRARSRATGGPLPDVRTTSGCAQLPPANFPIDDAALLSDYMMQHVEGESGISGAKASVAASLGVMFASIGVVQPEIGAIGGAILFVNAKWNEMRAFLYPWRITKVDFDVSDGARIPEDRMHDGPPYPEFSNARVWAENKGWNVTKATLETFLTFSGLAGAMPSSGSAGADVIWQETVNRSLDDLPPGACWAIQKTMWGGINAMHEDYLKAKWTGESIDPIPYEYFQPLKIGDSVLRLTTNSDAFTGPVLFKEKTVGVVMKNVQMLQTEITAMPGEEVIVTALVTDSKRPDLVEWTVPDVVGAFMVEDQGGGMHELRFTAPDDRDVYPFTVSIKSVSMTLEPTDPERMAQAEIKVEAGVKVTPETNCLSNGASAGLVAEVTGLGEGEDDSVEWSVSGGGNVMETGEHMAVYDSPASGMGVATITATLSSDSDIKGETTIVYGSCDINLDLGGVVQSDISGGFPAVEEMVGSDPFMPNDVGQSLPIPFDWWRGRTRTKEASQNETYFETANGIEYNLRAAAFSETTFHGSTASEATINGSWSIHAECQAVPLGEPGEVACSSANTGTAWWPTHYIFVREAGAYRIRVEMNCSGKTWPSDGVYAAGGFFFMFRWANGVGDPLPPNGFDFMNLIDPTNPFGISPLPSDPLLPGYHFVCDSDAPVIIDKIFNLVGPTMPGDRDVVVLSSTITTTAGAPWTNPLNPMPPTAGSAWDTFGTVSASISVTRVGN